MNEGTPDILVAEILGLSDWIDVQTQKFNEHLKPHKEKLEALKLTLQDLLLVTNLKSHQNRCRNRLPVYHRHAVNRGR